MRSTLLIIVMLGCECRGSRKCGGMRKSVTVKLSLSYRSVYLNKAIIFDKLDKLLKKLGVESFNPSTVNRQTDRAYCLL